MTDWVQKLWGSQAPDPLPTLREQEVCGSRPLGSSSNTDFEMLISRLHPFMPSSLCEKANSVRREPAELERGEMQRAAGAHSFSLGRVSARRFPEPSDQGPEWEGTSPPPASRRQSAFCSAFFL